MLRIHDTLDNLGIMLVFPPIAHLLSDVLGNGQHANETSV